MRKPAQCLNVRRAKLPKTTSEAGNRRHLRRNNGSPTEYLAGFAPNSRPAAVVCRSSRPDAPAACAVSATLVAAGRSQGKNIPVYFQRVRTISVDVVAGSGARRIALLGCDKPDAGG